MSLSAAFLFATAGIAQAASPNVVVSIKPIHSLVASVMKGVGEPTLIVEGAASPHTYSLKPSNAAALQDADIVFWVGHGLEAFLAKPLEALGNEAIVVELEDAPGLEKLSFRAGGPFEQHSDEQHEDTDRHDIADAHGSEDAHEHAHEGADTHIWLNPVNAKALAAAIESTLSAADPSNAPTYEANLAALNQSIDALDREIAETLTPVKDKPFIVFHDAYQYFEHRYGMRVAGSITVSPETTPGAERISQIRQKVTELGAACVFAEPQFEPKLVNVVLEGTTAKSGVLDPEGATLAEGPNLYTELMRAMAASMRQCLGSGG
ncbi:zinc ABC transporter substrate-binding protein ZnuA [Rhizobium sp. ARZ01]|uniref:zinc ABC transporter substrate-binding protein ZnuA n=1 Tax=Rhizobium sp. ARZ01 TaxID=2769313 RepID=UPI001781C7BA|nr:zinc ABC transporter substrate-binding protein ZnuA [Rhizobium sp. ARZ01]MBD9372176.1 zinc ABC transporter substrate-binding protein ZnuA [Rhizobium sp. ARZ01]